MEFAKKTEKSDRSCCFFHISSVQSCWDRLVSIISKLHKTNFHFISAVACDTSTVFHMNETQTCTQTAVNTRKWNNIRKRSFTTVMYFNACMVADNTHRPYMPRAQSIIRSMGNVREQKIAMKLAHNCVRLLNSPNRFYQILFVWIFFSRPLNLFCTKIYITAEKRLRNFHPKNGNNMEEKKRRRNWFDLKSDGSTKHKKHPHVCRHWST